MTNERTISPAKQKLVDKLSKSIDTVEQMLNDLGSLLSSDEHRYLQNLKETSSKLKRKLETDEFEIAIVGLEKAGKSTFANALMKANLLPAYDPRCTYTSTKIVYDKVNKAAISFYSESEFNDYIRGMLQTLGFSNYEKFHFVKDKGLTLNNKLLSESDFGSEYDKELEAGNIPPAIDKLYGNSMREEICSIIKYAVLTEENKEETKGDYISKWLGTGSKEITSSGEKKEYKEILKNYIANAWNALAVKDVVINSNELGEEMQNAVIYDVPGFDSPTAKHKEQTLERMENADAVVIIANSSKPDNTKASLDLLDEYDEDGLPLKNKLFVFSNRIEDAADVSTSMKTIEKNWEKYCDKENRIIYGSALAYLQENKLIGKDQKVVDALGRFKANESNFPNGFGIREIHEKLKLYNINDRPGQLQFRINNIIAEITTMLKNFSKKYSGNEVGDELLYTSEHLECAGKFLDEKRPEVTKKLQMLKQSIKEEMQKRPLSDQIRNYINENITPEKNMVTDEEIEHEKLKNSYVEGGPATIDIEIEVRKNKFRTMYDDFSKKVIKIADSRHAEYATKIVEAVMETMEVGSNHQYYQKIRENLINGLLPYRNELAEQNEEYSKVYYQTLIERFSRDIYEILILKQYTKDRLERFEASMRNFFSISVFYRNPNEEENSSYLSTTLKEQPLCKMLLFHHYLDLNKKLADLTDAIVKKARLVEVSDEIKESIKRAFFALNGNHEEVLEKIDEGTKNHDDREDFRQRRIRDILNDIISRNKSCDITDMENFRQYYIQYFNTFPDTVEHFREEFNSDVEILKDILSNAVIYAIDMEKPFVAREEKTIDDILDNYIPKDPFRELVNKNIQYILCDKFNAIEEEEREKRKRREFCRLANKLNETLNQE